MLNPDETINHRFYGERIDTPMSAYHNTEFYDQSRIGQLHDRSGGSIWIEEIPPVYHAAQRVWRVADINYSQEDTTMSYFLAYDQAGRYLGSAVFGVTWAGCESRITGGFHYPPLDGNHYYIPVNGFVTQETGGYKVRVLDLLNPSEQLAFGLYKTGKAHHGVIVRFRLFELKPGYPNDFLASG